MSFTFRLINKCYQNASDKDYGNAHFLIEENDWNDYMFYVTYHLHATPLVTLEETRYLGYIKIMKIGQAEKDIYLLNKTLGGYADFEELPENFVSMTQSLDVFGSLNMFLNAPQKKDFVRQMHLILSDHDEYYKMAIGQPAFEKGLLRDSSMESYSLKKGHDIMLSGETYYDLRKEKLIMRFNNIGRTVPVNFSCLPEIEDEKIPNGIMTFIGKNGSGKSTLIYQLAKVMYAYPDQRFKLKEDIGIIEPVDIGISKLFLISYSPFDNFVLPGIGGEDYRLILSGMEKGNGRLVFCGIRDVKLEIEHILKESTPETYDNLFKKVRVGQTILKPVGLLAEECINALSIVLNDKKRKKLWDGIMSQATIAFQDISSKMYSLLYEPEEIVKKEFINLSTGFKYYLHALSHVMAYIEPNSIILFDEPENHIHPPMLIFMLSSLRHVISQYNSIMMIATHSPIIVQESFSENVYIVRNMGDRTSVSHPIIETYGANIGEITSEVFDLTTDLSTHYEAYDLLYEDWNTKEDWHSLDDMLNSFKQHMKGKISHQMLTYVILKYFDTHPEVAEEGGE